MTGAAVADHALADFCRGILDLSGSPLPTPVEREARRALLNVTATTVSGMRHPGSAALVRAALALSGPGQVALPGSIHRLTRYWAALCIGFAGHVDDFDDTHLSTVIHPGASTLGAMIAAATERDDCADSLSVFAVAIETQLRFGLALGPEHYEHGWHTTGTCGVMGAGVAAALTFGLSAADLAGALSVAATTTLGHRESFGSDGKALHPGKAAANGVLAALCAAEGVTGNPAMITGPRGYLQVLADVPRPEELTARLGDHWHLLDLTYKPYPCGIVAHPAIDAARTLRSRLAGREVRSVEVHCHPLVLDLMGNRCPATGLEARFSTTHAVACALRTGEFGLADVTDEAAMDPAIGQLRDRVSLLPDPGIRREQASVTLVLGDGMRLTEAVPAARGSIDRPLSDDELAAKAYSLLHPHLGPSAADALIGEITHMSSSSSITSVLAGTVPPSPRAAETNPSKTTYGPLGRAQVRIADGPTRRLCRFVAEFPAEEMPATVRGDAVRVLADALAVGLAGSRHQDVHRTLRGLNGEAGTPGVRLIGHAERLMPQLGALVNGMATHILDYDDTHLAADTHASAPVLAALLAACDLAATDGRAVSGTEALVAFIIGMEASLHLASGIQPAHFERGWHTTATVGRIGAAVAAGRILRLDPDQLRAAVGFASTQAAGSRAAFGTPLKSWQVGKAAADGLEATLLARGGLHGPSLPIEGRRGFAAIMANKSAAEAEHLYAELGRTWHTERLALKPYPCGVVAHAAIDAALQVRSQLPAAHTMDAVDSVLVGVYPAVQELMGNANPRDGLQAKFSLTHCVAAALTTGAVGPGQFSDRYVNSANVRAFRAKVRMEPDPALAKDSAWIVLRTKAGSDVQLVIDHATGSLANPLQREHIRAKAIGMFPGHLTVAVDRLFSAAFSLEKSSTTSELLDAAFTPAHAASAP